MFKKSIFISASLALLLGVAFQANAGFNLKKVLKGKSNDSSSTSSSNSGSTNSGGSIGNSNKVTIKNDDPIGYKFEYQCALNEDKSFKHTIVKPGESLTIEGNNCTYHYIAEYDYDEKEGVQPGLKSTQHGRHTNIPTGNNTRTIKFGDIHDDNSLKWHLSPKMSGMSHSDFYADMIQGEVTKKYKGKSYSSAISYMNKLLKTSPKTSSSKETTWVVNKPEFGDYCVHVWGKHLNTRPSEFAYASASEYKKSSSYCSK